MVRVSPQLICYVVGLLLLLTSCHKADKESCVLLAADFEKDEGWETPLTPSLSTEQVHSGRYAYRLGQGVEYSSNYLTKLSKCSFLPRKLRLSAWVYLPNGRVRTTMLVVQVLCHGRRPDMWESLEISSKVRRYQVWVPIQKHIRLPSDLDPSDEVKIYVWHGEPNGENMWFDDLLVEGRQ